MSVALFALSAVAGCASTPTSTTTVTSADVAPSGHAPVVRDMRADPTTHYKDVTPDSTTHFEKPAGDLVCHVTTSENGTAELYLAWSKSGDAKGTLRRVAPSGDISERAVHAERVQGAIVADDVLSTDLVSHAAMIKEHKGKKLVRLDGWKTWVPCQ